MANEFTTPTFDQDFVIGVSSDAELDENLTKITTSAGSFSNAINSIVEYFNKNDLWQGEDAEALRAAATAEGGPIKKLLEYEAELNKLSRLADSLRGAIGTVQTGLKTNVNTAMGTNDGGGA